MGLVGGRGTEAVGVTRLVAVLELGLVAEVVEAHDGVLVDGGGVIDGEGLAGLGGMVLHLVHDDGHRGRLAVAACGLHGVIGILGKRVVTGLDGDGLGIERQALGQGIGDLEDIGVILIHVRHGTG